MANYTENFGSESGDTIDSAELETEFDAIAAAIATKIDSDGSGVMSGALAMGSNKITGLASATADADAVPFSLLAVRQIKIGTSTSNVSHGGTSFLATGLEVTITPLFSDSVIIVIANAYVSADNSTAGSTANRYANWQIYRSSGTPASIANSSVGRVMSTATSSADASLDRLNMLGTETPGAGTHTYQLRYQAVVSGLPASMFGSSGGQASIIAVEVRP